MAPYYIKETSEAKFRKKMKKSEKSFWIGPFSVQETAVGVYCKRCYSNGLRVRSRSFVGGGASFLPSPREARGKLYLQYNCKYGLLLPAAQGNL